SILVGTPHVMAPEQILGGVVSPAADMYALGVLTYQLLAGRAPFSGELARLLFAHAFEPPRPLDELRPELPSRVIAAVHSAIAKDPTIRPASATILAQALVPPAAMPPHPPRVTPGSA